jgi:exodeoxyribonuclease III
MNRFALLALAVVVVLLVALAFSSNRRSSSSLWGTHVVGCQREGESPGQPGELRALSFNLWGGGRASGQPLDNSAEVIRRTQPHVVGLQEPAFQGADQMKELGQLSAMQLVPDAQLLTSLPVVRAWKVEGANFMGAAELRWRDAPLYVYNVHLTSYPYGPHAIRDGNARTPDEALAVETPRVKEIEDLMADMRRQLPAGARVVLLGDFNTPSHRDWGTPTARTYNMAVPWPVTVAVEREGFVDTYRAVHPAAIDRTSPVTNTTIAGRPGFTYSPVHQEDNDHVPYDRIDMVFARGPRLRVCDSFVVGEDSATSDIVVSPWPSDHRAVLSFVDWDE